MSTGLIPNVGEARMAKTVLNASTDSGPENLVLRLFKNDVTPTSTMTLSDYTEATFTGYAAVTLSSDGWNVSSTGSETYAEYSSGVPFTCSGTTAEDIYGFYLTGADSSDLYWSERFTVAPRTITYSGDALTPRPKIMFGQSGLWSGWAGIQHCWHLDEESGTRYDVVGTAHLTDNNTVQGIPHGPTGKVASFVSDTEEYLAAATGLVSTGDFTVAGWIYVPVGKVGHLYSQTVDWDNYIDISLNGADNTLMMDYSGAANESFVSTNPAPGWVFVVGGFDTAVGKSFISANGAAKIYAADSVIPVDLSSGASSIGIGELPDCGDQQQGRTGLWNIVLSDSVIASLFNFGNAKTYADLTATEKIGIVGYWNADEGGGDRADSHDSNTLTDVNTVDSETAVAGAMHNVAANFVAANSEYLTYDGPVTPAAPAAWSISGWFYIPSVLADWAVLMDGADTGADPGHWGLYKVAPNLQFISRGGGSPAGAAIFDAWNFVYIEMSAGEAASISINAGTLVSGAKVSDRLTDVLFRVGSSTPAGGTYFTGLADEISVFNEVKDAAWRAAMWVAGAGRYYPD